MPAQRRYFQHLEALARQAHETRKCATYDALRRAAEPYIAHKVRRSVGWADRDLIGEVETAVLLNLWKYGPNPRAYPFHTVFAVWVTQTLASSFRYRNAQKRRGIAVPCDDVDLSVCWHGQMSHDSASGYAPGCNCEDEDQEYTDEQERNVS